MVVHVSVARTFFWVLFIVFLVERCNGATSAGVSFNVNQYGAKPDGVTDNSQAFLAAWKAACSSTGNIATLVIPRGTYLTGPVTFEGQCKVSQIQFQVAGVIKAPTDMSKFPTDEWIVFRDIHRLLLSGGGVFDGQGKSAWQCGQDPNNCKALPTTLQFTYVTSSIVSGISLVDSKQKHMKIYRCRSLYLNHLTITAPGDSPNTDGINVAESRDIGISDSNIGTGDDCISVLPGAVRVFVNNVFCGPGHGISVGSLGSYPDEKDVQTFVVTNITCTGTENGARIKTWGNSKSSISAWNITFDNIIMNNVKNPIIIDQQYCPDKTCPTRPSSVKIRDVTFKGIRGTSATQVAVNLVCSATNPCNNVMLENINLKPSGSGAPLTSFCSNVKGSSRGTQIPPACI